MYAPQLLTSDQKTSLVFSRIKHYADDHQLTPEHVGKMFDIGTVASHIFGLHDANAGGALQDLGSQIGTSDALAKAIEPMKSIMTEISRALA